MTFKQTNNMIDKLKCDESVASVNLSEILSEVKQPLGLVL
jgi:hypothetical protein